LTTARILALWLTPVVWLAVPTLVVEGGPDGVWAGLLFVVAPLLVLRTRGARAVPGGRDTLFPVVVLLLVVGLMLWANLALAADVASWLGVPRWQGIAAAAGGAWLLVLWRGAGRLLPWLLGTALVAALLPLAVLARDAHIGPLGAWVRVASQAAFRFPAESPWVTVGREVRPARGPGALLFEEEHRVIAVTPATLHVRARDGARVSDTDWELQAGQSVMMRPGDELTWTPGARLRFEAGKAVPGAPRSGIAWADGPRADGWRRWGLLVTVIAGASGLLGFGIPDRLSRRQMALCGAGFVVTFAWGLGWAIYCALGAPDIFLGGVSIERLMRPPPLASSAAAGDRVLPALLPTAGLLSFLASTVALRERLGALDVTGGGEIGHDLGLWSAILGAAALASLWPADAWLLTLWALGLAGSALSPALLWPPRENRPAVGIVAGLVGLAVFGALTVAGHWAGLGARLGAGSGTGSGDGWPSLVLAFPAVAAAPTAALVLWLARRAGPS
jgi:hypothetical protein